MIRPLSKIIPAWQNVLLTLLGAGLLVLAFPDFEYWFLAWFALVPLMWSIEREGSVLRSFILGWIFGTAYFFGTCWWLTYAPIHYAALPWPLAYSLIFIACLGAGVFPGIFATILSVLLKRFGSWAFLPAPFVWVFSEFARYWITGNNWNAVGYSQALTSTYQSLPSLAASFAVGLARFGGVLSVSFVVLTLGAILIKLLYDRSRSSLLINGVIVLVCSFWYVYFALDSLPDSSDLPTPVAHVISVQGNVPMSGLDSSKLRNLRDKQFQTAANALDPSSRPGILTEDALSLLPPDERREFDEINAEIRSRFALTPKLVVLPESPMNFMYNDDREFQQFVREFTTRNNVSLLFNSAEPDARNGKYFNSAVMVGPDGKIAAQYDKVYLLPFGEAVPVPLQSIVPAFVGSFSYGSEYDLIPVGDAKAGIMICFESHFGQLGREYVRNGADMLIEMTNDGYLGPTPVLRQHLANAVFRAVETNRPVLRVTNVGITAYIDERGNIHDPAPTYTEATRVWTVSKSDGSQTLYVRFGDWFAWLCTVISVGLLLLCAFRRRKYET